MKLFQSGGANARVDIQTEDHCPPHVHALNRADRWEAKVEVSFVDNSVTLMAVMPAANVPAGRTIDRLLDDVAERLSLCRGCWWDIYRDVCLTNKWVTVSSSGRVTILRRKRRGAAQVLAGSYEASTDRLALTLSDGSTVVTMAGDGVVER
jgi:hypothetical protein